MFLSIKIVKRRNDKDNNKIGNLLLLIKIKIREIRPKKLYAKTDDVIAIA